MIGGGGYGAQAGGGAGACIVAINQTLSAGSCVVYVGSGSVGSNGGIVNGDDSYIRVDNADRYRAKGGGSSINGDPNDTPGNAGGCGSGAHYDANGIAEAGGAAVSTNVVNGSLANIGPSITSTYAVMGNAGGSIPANNQSRASGGGIGAPGVAGGNGGNGAYQVTLTGAATPINFRSYFANGGNSFGVQDGTSSNYYIGGGGGSYNINGSPYWRLGGLGGGGSSGNPSIANTGSGANAFNSGASGIVIIRYRNPSTSTTTYTHTPTLTTTATSTLQGNPSIELVRGTQGDSNTDYKLGNYGGDFKVISSISNTDTDRLNITSAGNVGIGTTSPQVKLHITGDIYATDNITAYFSDERLKTKISSIHNPLEIIRRLNGFYYIPNDLAHFNGITNTDMEVGLSAQEVQRVLPEIVKIAPFDSIRNAEGVIVSKSGENYLTMSYERLTPVFVEAIKELEEINIEMNQEITLINETLMLF
jgi:hypothetical protein